MNALALAIGLTLALAVAPFGLGGYETNVLMMILFFVILAVGLNLVTGYCGQFSFATGVFYGLGAYTAAIMSRDLGTSIWVHLPAGALVAGLFGLLLGIPALRLKGTSWRSSPSRSRPSCISSYRSGRPSRAARSDSRCLTQDPCGCSA